jgi:L-fuconolactonase
LIVDGHHHLWNLERSPQAWLTGAFSPIARTFEPEELEPLLDASDVGRTILVQSACADADTDQLFAHAAEHDWIGAVTAWLPLASPEQTRKRLDELSDEPKLRAVRHPIHDEADAHWIVRPDVLESLAQLEERGLILELPVVFPRHFGDVGVLARSFPELTIVIDHLGKPPIGTDEMPAWEAELRAAAAHPNVAAKVSGLNTCIRRRGWTGSDLRPAVAVALDCFGADRLLFGSDWPVCLLNGSYARVVDEMRRVIDALAPAHADAILGGTARRLYALDGVSGATTSSTGRADGRAAD